MATNDQINVKFNTEGIEKLDAANVKLGNLGKTSEETAKVVRAFNTRTMTANIQDIAVQAELGVSWLRILGQQGSEVLAAFGPTGAAAGAALAVGIAIARPVLKELGVDLRSTKEAIVDLEKSTGNYIAAQKANQSSTAFLTSEYGMLNAEAKRFFEVQQELQKSKALYDLSASVGKLKDDFKAAGLEASEFGKSAFSKIPIAGEIAALPDLLDSVRGAWARFGTGLSAENAQVVTDLMKGVDAKNPKETAKALTDVLEYLKSVDGESSQIVKNFSATLEPIIKANNALLEQERNIKAASTRASELTAEMIVLQNSFQPDINASKRNFDQISAIRKESALKLAEFNKQISEKEKEDGINRWKERSAMELRIKQDESDKIADFTKSQNEAYRTAVLQNITKKDQLSLQDKILNLSENGRLSAFNTLQLETDLLSNANAYQESLRAIGEQRRKNIIDSSMQSKLEKDAADIKTKSDENSYTAAERRQKSLIEAQQQIINSDAARNLLIRQTAEMSDRETRNAEAVFAINEERKKQILGLQQLDNPELKAAKEKEINDIYDARVISLKRQQDINLEIQQSFTGGWNKAFNNYVDNANNAVNQAQTIFSAFTTGMEDALFRLFKTGKLGWKSFVQDMVDTLLKSQIKQLMANVMTAGGNGNVFSSVGKMMGFADGGLIPTNSPVIVGERGPEIISGAAGRTVTPNNALGGTVTYNINAVDAQSFKQMLAADPTFLHAVAEQGRRRLPGAR